MRIGVGLSIPELATRGGRFSPASLFTSGVAGAWYDPSDVLLNWRTNLLTYSQEFDNAAWNKVAGSVTANQGTAPDGTLTADKLDQVNTSTSRIGTFAFTVTPSTSYAGTIYVKAFSGTDVGKRSTLYVYDVAAAAFKGVTAITLTDSWQRIQSNFTTGASTTSIFWNLGTETGTNDICSMLIWGAQLELGSTATTYQAITTPEQTYLTYDPQPVLYQDSAGTTPVTAVEQPVGLMLDKSQGLVLGSELVPDYDFATPASWTPETADWVVSGGKATYTKPGAGVQYLQSNDNISIVSGTWYKVTYTISGITASNNAIFGLFNKTASTNYLGGYQTITANGTYSIYFLATSSTTGIRIYGNAGSTSASWSFDSFGIKSLAGNHASQATAASRPILRARYNLLTYSEDFSNAVWSKTGITVGAAVTPPSGTSAAYEITSSATSIMRQTPTVLASNHIAQIYAKKKPGATDWVLLQVSESGLAKRFWFNVGNGTLGTKTGVGTHSISDAGNGWYRCIVAFATSAGTCLFDIEPVTADGGNTGDSAYIGGTDLRLSSTSASMPAYQRIAAATDYATAGFLPYLYFVTDDSFGTNSIDFTATDKMSVCAGVTKLSDAATGFIVELSASTSANNGSFYIAAPESTSQRYSVLGRGSSAPVASQLATTTSNTYLSPVTNVLTGTFDILGDSNILRLNGTQINQATGDQGTGNFGNYPLFIGRRNNASIPLNGNIYQLIVCGKTLSASELASTEAYVATKTGVVI